MTLPSDASELIEQRFERGRRGGLRHRVELLGGVYVQLYALNFGS